MNYLCVKGIARCNVWAWIWCYQRWLVYFPSLKDLAIAFLEISSFFFYMNIRDFTPPFLLFYLALPPSVFSHMPIHTHTVRRVLALQSSLTYIIWAIGKQVEVSVSSMVLLWWQTECPLLPRFLLNWPAAGKQWSGPAVPSPQGERRREEETQQKQLN